MPSGKNKPYRKPTFNGGSGLNEGWWKVGLASKERNKLTFNRKKKNKNKPKK